MPDRFYHPPPLHAGAATITGAEAHHLIHVLRAKPGLAVTLFSGDGKEATATVVKVDRAVVHVEVGEPIEIDRETPIAITVGVALPKGDRQRWLVEKLTELGAARLVPLITERGVAQPTGETLRRLERAVIEASKQCGRNRLMQISDPMRLIDYLQTPATLRVVAHPSEESSVSLTRSGDAAIAVGPEGGFTDAEIQTARDAGWQFMRLGKQILRTETAAIALVAVICIGRLT